MKTPAAARHLGVTYHRMIDLLRFDKIPHPARDGSGHFVWSPADIERARAHFVEIERARAHSNRLLAEVACVS